MNKSDTLRRHAGTPAETLPDLKRQCGIRATLLILAGVATMVAGLVVLCIGAESSDVSIVGFVGLAIMVGGGAMIGLTSNWARNAERFGYLPDKRQLALDISAYLQTEAQELRRQRQAAERTDRLTTWLASHGYSPTEARSLLDGDGKSHIGTLLSMPITESEGAPYSSDWGFIQLHSFRELMDMDDSRFRSLSESQHSSFRRIDDDCWESSMSVQRSG